MNERAKILRDALTLTTGQRHADYGDPTENMGHIADIFEAITGIRLSPRDVALFLHAVKLARLAKSPSHEDSYTDAAAYIGIAYEVHVRTHTDMNNQPLDLSDILSETLDRRGV